MSEATQEAPEYERRDPLLVSIDETCALIGRSRATVFNLLQSGAIESRYHGRRRLVIYASVVAWIDNLPTVRGD